MDEEPLVRVLRGNPAPEELASLVTVLAGRPTSTDSHCAQVGVSDWALRARPGARPRSWKAAGLPR